MSNDIVNRTMDGSIVAFGPSENWTPEVKEKAEQELREMIADVSEVGNKKSA